MEYRKLPHGKEQIGTLGLGMGGIQNAPETEIEAIIRKAIDHGINFFDLCAGGKNVYTPFGRAIAGQREKIYVQMHFGAVYNAKGEYGWSRDLKKIKNTLAWELNALGTDYIDFGFLHCVDEHEDFDKLVSSGVLDYVKKLHKQGVVRHLGFSSHTPEVAQRVMDTIPVDMMMFSINPAYDYECGDEYGIGSVSERARLFRRCEKDGIGISVMKPFHGGQLLSAEHSPFKTALSHAQCIQYALDRPGVLTVVPGVRNLADLEVLLAAIEADPAEKDYAIIGTMTLEKVKGSCVYCHHCQPCPVGIDIGLINKYYDLALAGDGMATDHYKKLEIAASACVRCGHCDSRCPFGVKQSERMQEISEYFGG